MNFLMEQNPTVQVNQKLVESLKKLGTAKIAFYGRVNENKVEFYHRTHQSFCQAHISHSTGCTFAGVYLDTISDNSHINSRLAFERLKHAAKKGKVTYIIVPEVSTLSANAMEALKISFDFLKRDPPVYLYFMKENLDLANIRDRETFAVASCLLDTRC